MKTDRLNAAREIGQRISDRVARRTDYSGSQFETDITTLLDVLFPFSVLPGVRLFSSQERGRIAYGYEIDNLLHFRQGGADYVVLIDAKRQSVKIDGNRWSVTYDDGKKCAKQQIDNHIRTVWEYLQPISGTIELKFIGIVVSSDKTTIKSRSDGFHNAELLLCSFEQLAGLLAERFSLFGRGATSTSAEVLRVSQSHFLDLLRLSLPVPELGHPEIANAMRYIDRCRRTLDDTLFRYFEPTPQRWVINGSAGMGKSVLLAYTAAVLSSGYELYRSLGDIGLQKAMSRFVTIGYDPHPSRGGIAIVTMSMKQLESLRGWFGQFVEKFQLADTDGAVRFRPPEFILCRPSEAILGVNKRWSAILVDEAHDLPPYAASQIVANYDEQTPYLVVACDRHQRLQLAGSDARILPGVDFTNRSKRLQHIYRNPAPVYIASLALMFRWSGEAGPKVLPRVDQMNEYFGFEAKRSANGDISAVLRSDAHPGNSWCHTVARFPDVLAVYTLLSREQLQQHDVLWVRFSEEDPDFDYEKVAGRWTYHNCRTGDAQKISDKYIKGQDYPVVVIEGFPSFMDRWEDSGDYHDAESRMWAFRRELYLCASRATGFLYFVCNVGQTAEITRIQREIDAIVEAVSIPENRGSSATRSWSLSIKASAMPRRLDVFADAETTPIASEDEAARPREPFTERQRAPAKITAQAHTGPSPSTIKTFAHLPAKRDADRPAVERALTRLKHQPPPSSKEKKHKVQAHLLKAPVVRFPQNGTVRQLAAALGVKPFQLIADLLQYGKLVTANELLSKNTAKLLCEKRGFRLEQTSTEEAST